MKVWLTQYYRQSQERCNVCGTLPICQHGATQATSDRSRVELYNVLHSGAPRNFVREGGVSTNSVEDRGQRERGSGGDSHLVRGSGGSCNLVREISFRIVKFS